MPGVAGAVGGGGGGAGALLVGELHHGEQGQLSCTGLVANIKFYGDNKTKQNQALEKLIDFWNGLWLSINFELTSSSSPAVSDVSGGANVRDGLEAKDYQKSPHAAR